MKLECVFRSMTEYLWGKQQKGLFFFTQIQNVRLASTRIGPPELQWQKWPAEKRERKKTVCHSFIFCTGVERCGYKGKRKWNQTCPRQTNREKIMVPSLWKKETETELFHFDNKQNDRMLFSSLYLMPKTLSIIKPPKKQRTTLGQEYQA